MEFLRRHDPHDPPLPVENGHRRDRLLVVKQLDVGCSLDCELLHHLFALAIANQQQDVDPILDDPDLQHRDEGRGEGDGVRSEEHTSELQSPCNLVCRLLLEKKKKNKMGTQTSIDKRKKQKSV